MYGYWTILLVHVGDFECKFASDYDWFVGKPLFPVNMMKLPGRPGGSNSLPPSFLGSPTYS